MSPKADFFHVQLLLLTPSNIMEYLLYEFLPSLLYKKTFSKALFRSCEDLQTSHRS